MSSFAKEASSPIPAASTMPKLLHQDLSNLSSRLEGGPSAEPALAQVASNQCMAGITPIVPLG